MRQSIAVFSLLASTAIAQDVVSFYFPGGAEGVNPVATIKTANPSTTEMRVACPTGVDSTDCGWGNGVDVKVISGTIYQGTMSAEQFTMSYSCNYNTKAVEMTCIGDLTGEDTQTATFSGSDISFVPATVVQGKDLLKASATTTAASNSGSAASSGLKTAVTSASASVASGSALSASSSRASGSSASATGSSSAAPASTGAAAKFGIEGSALLALAGAAAVGLW